MQYKIKLHTCKLNHIVYTKKERRNARPLKVTYDKKLVIFNEKLIIPRSNNV